MSLTITSKSSTLTEEQKKRMEENRLRALQLKQKSFSNSIIPNTKPAGANESNSSNQPGQITPTNGKCVYLNSDPTARFEILIGYNKELIEIFKTVSSRKYDPETKRWNFALTSYDDLLLKVKSRLSSVKIEPLDRVASSKSTIAKFHLIDRTRFEVQAEYNLELQELFKTMTTKRYDPQTKKWSFELKEYQDLVKKILNKFKRGEVQLVPLPNALLDVFQNQLKGLNYPKIDPSIDFEHIKKKIDADIAKSLMPFQIEGVKFAIQQNGRLLLADDMGLGKTVQALAIASYYKEEWPLFIIVPSSVKFMWKESAKRWLSESLAKVCNLKHGDLVDDFIQVMENGRQMIYPKSKIIISSYDLLAKNVDEISLNDFKVIIADECHLLKNNKAARTKAVFKLIQNSNRVILLSGTPALSRPAELFSQIQAINPNLFASFHDYGMRYCDGKESRFGMDYSGYSNMTELRLLLEEKILIRREKKDVIQELPSKMREMVILNPSLIELNTKTLKQASNKMDQNLKGMEKRGALLKYFQETSKVKAKAVTEYVSDLLESDKKFLVFAHHQSMLDELEAEIQKNKYDYIRIDGSTSSENRQVFVQRFQNSDRCQCALLSITAANSGITLTQANLVVFAELFWNPGILVQAEDRVYRIGQKNSVIIQYLCAKGTADDQIWPLVNEKLNVLSRAGLTRENLSEANTVNRPKTNLFDDLIEEDLKKNEKTVQSIEIDNDITLEEDDDLKSIDLAQFERPPIKKPKQ
ncbi:SWI SNF-related matrix-associated actin-dependent regulator of chromatin subfamily A 1 [Brachionus plicatilis]|uniref:SWI SNF-related matrix-associated actin-dependent regulator of chromatin subfamily A 1 n=1 Tax=Brachionus plicatilis TaxID=10195 RepID=A0A3M7PN48_BRAPC|nr:SWI SNF-related matrix-associated actin-dependent regulator of chromatin subfamily A 1 [Brachionus plicatilis]